MNVIVVQSTETEQLIDITPRVQEQVDVERGLCHLFVPHTTAGITINENADPDVRSDLLRGLNKIVPNIRYDHIEGNSPAHLKASILGMDITVPIIDGRLALGTWQGIYFCEFDGPRERKLCVLIKPL